MAQTRAQTRDALDTREAVDAVRVQAYLNTVVYPASKDALIEFAESRNAPLDVLETLDQLPDRSYETPLDVSVEIDQDVTGDTRRGVLSPMTQESKYME